MSIDVFINESLPILNVNVPKIKESSNEVTSDLVVNPIAVINGENSSQVHIAYKPNPEYQRLSSKDGMKGQFIVQYDVDRKGQSSEVQVYDGYMVHFFAPESLQVLPKHMVFVLDVSGSMSDGKLKQLKNAMVTILTDLTSQDYFSIMTFSYSVKHWVPKGELESEKPHSSILPAKEHFVDEAMDYVLSLGADGGTNIDSALSEAINIVQEGQQTLPKAIVPAVVFLTDGQPTSGESRSDVIRQNLKDKNSDTRAPVYGLAFGEGADYGLLKQISSDNRAFARKIFAESDSAIQMEDFYAEISSPLLNNVTFEYVGPVEEPAENIIPTTCFHSGSEIVSVVKLLPTEQAYDDNESDNDSDNESSTSQKPPSPASRVSKANNGSVELIVRGKSSDGEYEHGFIACGHGSNLPTEEVEGSDETPRRLPFFPCFPTPPHLPSPLPSPRRRRRSVNFIERMWAFLSLEKLLDDKADNGNMTREQREEKATDLALKYNFVSDVTSLVVVKPNDDDVSNSTSAESKAVLKPIGEAGKDQYQYRGGYGGNSYAAPPIGLPGPPSRQRLASPKIRTSGNFPGNSMIKAMAVPQSIGGGGFLSNAMPGPQPASGSSVVSLLLMNRLTTTTPAYDYAYDSYDNDYGAVQPSTTTTTGTTTTTTTTTATTTLSCSECKIVLYSKTLLRGDKIELTDDVTDLSDLGFDNKAISVAVTGACRWYLYQDKDYKGQYVTFVDGSYKDAVDLGRLFRKTSSVKMTGGC